MEGNGRVNQVIGKGSPEVDTALKGNCDQHAGFMQGEFRGGVRRDEPVEY